MTASQAMTLLDQEVARFLYTEAALLDDRRWDDWLELWTEDATYSMPVRREQLHEDSWGRPLEQSFTGPGQLHYVDEPRLVLDVRVAKLKSGKAWAEQPPSHTTRLITNVHVLEESDDSLLVHSNFLLHRTRGSSQCEQFIGTRRDLLNRAAGGWSIAERRVYLNTGVLGASNLQIFF